MRIAVCDDRAEDALALRKFLGGHDVRIYSDAGSLLKDVASGKMRFELYLLDIFMDGSANGVELAGELRGLQDEAAICFISTSDDFYREAYDLYAVQYLIKPVDEESVQRLLDKVAKNIAGYRERKLSFQFRGQTGSIPYEKILYISSREHTLSIYCRDGSVQECRGRLDELARQVCGDVFARCHQSFVVNMYHVDHLSGNDLMVGGRQIPVSRRYFADVKKRYQEILFEEVD